MQLDNYGQLAQAVADADLILVGLGEEWVLTEEIIMDDLSDKSRLLYEMFSIAGNEERYHGLIPLLIAHYCDSYIPQTLKNAYENMLELLQGKNYFVLSLTVDSYLKRLGFDSGRCVNPCGTYKRLQCGNGCGDLLVSAEELCEEVSRIVEDFKRIDFDSQVARQCIEQCLVVFEKCRCEQCGEKMSFNLLDAKKYREEGYHEQWQNYMKWLQGTLNKKLCIIEAGAGMKLPSVIRWPFEKTVFYNQKANMVRVHEKFYQVNEETAERTYGCKCHSVKLFAKKNVEAY